MAIECIVILLILVIASYVFLRSKRKIWFTGVIPLMLMPVVNLIFYPRRMETLTYGHTARLIIYAVTFIAASLWMILWARRLPSRRSRVGYTICAIGFTLLLTLVLLFKGASFS